MSEKTASGKGGNCEQIGRIGRCGVNREVFMTIGEVPAAPNPF